MTRVVKTVCLIIALFTFVSSLALAKAEILPTSSDKHFAGWEKLNLPLRSYLENLEKEKIELIIRTNKAVDDSDKKSLQSAGFQFRSVIPSGKKKTILTGSILPFYIEKLAALSFVESIEASTRLQYQKKTVLEKN